MAYECLEGFSAALSLLEVLMACTPIRLPLLEAAQATIFSTSVLPHKWTSMQAFCACIDKHDLFMANNCGLQELMDYMSGKIERSDKIQLTAPELYLPSVSPTPHRSRKHLTEDQV